MYIYHDGVKVETIPLNDYTTDQLHAIMEEKGINKKQGWMPAEKFEKLRVNTQPLENVKAIPLMFRNEIGAMNKENKNLRGKELQENEVRMVDKATVAFLAASVFVAAVAWKKARSNDQEGLKFYRTDEESVENANRSEGLRKR